MVSPYCFYLRARAGWLIVCLMVSWVGSAGAAIDLSQAFDEANKLYEQGKYGAAADAYEQLLKEGQTTSPVLFNLGNARFRSGETGRAIIAFSQAERLDPRDAAVKANLQFARRTLRGAEESTQPLWLRLLGRLHINEWAFLTSLSLWICFLALAACEWRPAWKPSLRRAVRISGLMAVVSGAALLSLATLERRRVAVVVVKEALVRFTPIEESPVRFTANDGLELIVVGQKPAPAGQPEWLEVRDPANRIGWVKRDQVGFVKES